MKFNLKQKLLLIIIATSIFYLASMIDTKPNSEQLVNCYIGDLIFELKAKDCKTAYGNL